MIKIKFLVKAIFVVTLFLAMSCDIKEKQEIIFKEVILKNEDSTKVWLRKKENCVNDKNYFPVFYKYYDDKIMSKNYLAAADILDILTVNMITTYNFDNNFLEAIKKFDNKYRSKIPALNSTFVDHYYAHFYYDKGDIKKSSDYFIKITALEPNDYNSCRNIADANYYLAYNYYRLGKQNLSLESSHTALKLYTKINDERGIGNVYSNYSNIYSATRNHKKGLEYINKAIHYSVKLGDTSKIYINLYNKIFTLKDASDPKLSDFIDSVYVSFIQSKFKNYPYKIRFSIQKVKNLIVKNKLLEAKNIIDEIEPIVKKVNSNELNIDYNTAIIEYEIKKNPKNVNLILLKNAITIAEANKNFEILLSYYDILKQHALVIDDFKNALVYNEKLGIAKDSLGNIAMQNKITEIETKYQTQKKVQQLATQEKIIAQKNAAITLMALLFLALVLVIVVYQKQQKQNKLQLEKQNAQLYTKQLLEKTEEERKRIASDLHDSVSHELLSLKNLFEQKTEITNNKIDAIINDIRIISRNLHPVMFDKIGLKESIIQLVERTQLSNNFMVSAEIEYQSDLQSSTELQIYRIVQEALSNIIKYADALAAKITITELKNMITIEIKDNGKGFDVQETLSSKTAFGLHNIIERSRAIGGTTKIISDKNGTVIKIEIEKS